MKNLFSPVGTADPITLLGDGPLLHIVRWYKPDNITLFLSPKIMKYQEKDARYTRAIKLLCDKTGQRIPEIKLVVSDNKEVHRFDIYIEEFRKCLREIAKKHDDEMILANVSSGTPAMEEALVALSAIGEFDMELLQVATPRRDSNKKEDRENPDAYELEVLWELNPDNEGSAPCRIEETQLPNHKDRLLRVNIAELIKSYDYTAALKLAKQLNKGQNIYGDLKNLVEQINLRCDGNKLVNYLRVMEVRLEQQNYVEFCRSLTPALFETAKRILAESFDISQFLIPGTNKLDLEKVHRNRVVDQVIGRDLHEGSPNHLASWHLIKLFKQYCGNQKASVKLDRLRDFESGCRNTLAHEITKVDKATFEKDGRMKLDEVMRYLFELNDIKPGWFRRRNDDLLELLRK
ncbi:type III-A CRISPR-associated CARF protein Csm6 [Olegusella massiliensis]|uniref:type III-A CRISPR-associated CARF protein Csm6 n=1 Tax=Olegusella massiliensis TaxID=1776381 RepID=UPI000837F886|nr:hypothetical protein [Olegusella massiliensis]